MPKRSYSEEAKEWGIVTGLQQVLGYQLKTTYDVIDIAEVARLFGVQDKLLTRLEAMWEHVVMPVGEIDNDLMKISSLHVSDGALAL